MTTKMYALVGPDGKSYQDQTRGTLGGYMRGNRRIYGRLDCANALSWIKKGHYVRYRVFFADETTAIVAGFRPCGKCMKEKYDAWRKMQME